MISTNPFQPSFADRVLARLIQAEAHESDPWYRDDCRQAFIVLSLALKGESQPFVSASYRMYGLHPDKLYPAILARREALLGPMEKYAQNQNTQELGTGSALSVLLQQSAAPKMGAQRRDVRISNDLPETARLGKTSLHASGPCGNDGKSQVTPIPKKPPQSISLRKEGVA